MCWSISNTIKPTEYGQYYSISISCIAHFSLGICLGCLFGSLGHARQHPAGQHVNGLLVEQLDRWHLTDGIACLRIYALAAGDGKNKEAV